MEAELHPREPARLAALRRYDILDTPREREFDDVADLARRICGTGVAVINLIDAGRQWFKAEVGLGVRETPIASSICAHVILQGEFVEISDTLADPRLRDNPLCLAEPGFRFYAGAVLTTADGLPIGTLCVLDYAPRRLDAVQRDTLVVLAAQVMRQLELRAALTREALLRREIDHRVKNSLASVSAFARLQRRASREPAVEATLRAVEQQVESVALLHAMIAEGEPDWIDLCDYLERLTVLLAATVPPGIAVTGSFAPLAGPAPVAAALGAIVNELVANAVKHSFDSGATGRIGLVGRGDGPAGYRIDCHDDGAAPLSPAAPPPATARGGLGLKIIAASIRQLNGTIAGGRQATGYATTVTFPRPAASLA